MFLSCNEHDKIKYCLNLTDIFVTRQKLLINKCKNNTGHYSICTSNQPHKVPNRYTEACVVMIKLMGEKSK